MIFTNIFVLCGGAGGTGGACHYHPDACQDAASAVAQIDQEG